jgi:hypothetical protein
MEPVEFFKRFNNDEISRHRYIYIGNRLEYASVLSLLVTKVCQKCLNESNISAFSLDPRQLLCGFCFKEKITSVLLELGRREGQEYTAQTPMVKVIDPQAGFHLLKLRRRFAILTNVPLTNEQKSCLGLEPVLRVEGEVPLDLPNETDF